MLALTIPPCTGVVDVEFHAFRAHARRKLQGNSHPLALGVGDGHACELLIIQVARQEARDANEGHVWPGIGWVWIGPRCWCCLDMLGIEAILRRALLLALPGERLDGLKAGAWGGVWQDFILGTGFDFICSEFIWDFIRLRRWGEGIRCVTVPTRAFARVEHPRRGGQTNSQPPGFAHVWLQGRYALAG